MQVTKGMTISLEWKIFIDLGDRTVGEETATAREESGDGPREADTGKKSYGRG